MSHFTYHASGGKYLVCDLQGGRYDGYYMITDPVVLSLGREFGATDLGPVGISNFMAHHKCTRFCNPDWKKPANAGKQWRSKIDYEIWKRIDPMVEDKDFHYLNRPVEEEIRTEMERETQHLKARRKLAENQEK